MGARDPLEEASRLHDRAVSWRAQGQYAEALASSQQTLALCEREVGPDHPDVANVLNTLAGTYEDQGNYAEAEWLYQRSVAIMAALTGSLEIETLRVQSLCGLAGLYRVQGRYGEAEPLFRRALAIFETCLGPTHPKVVTCLQNYAQLLRDTQRRIEALVLEARTRPTRPRRPRRSRT
jgi:tetratricopeptide (TPR) repeat protein